MTQRFGGVFSVLNRRDISSFYEAIDLANFVDTFGGGLEDYEDVIQSLERQSIDILIEIAEATRVSLNFALFDHGGPSEGEHARMSEEIGEDYWPTINKARRAMVFLSKLISKLERAQRKQQSSSLDGRD